MENERNEILSKLYVLRAGISAISVEKNKVVKLGDKKKREKDSRFDQNSAYEQKIKENNKKIAEEKEKLAWETKQSQFVFSPIKCALEFFWTYSLGIVTILLILSSFLLAIFPIFCFVAEFLEWINLIELKRILFWAFVDDKTGWIILFGVLGLVIGSLLLFQGVMELEWYKEWFWSYEWNAKKRFDAAPAKIAIINKSINALKKENEKFRNVINENLTSANTIETDINKEVSIKTLDCNSLYQALTNTYNSFLDERDWQNLDLLIFYFETRRADDMKEALQLVDKQVQNNAIVQAIGNATNQICNTIRSGFQQLQTTLVQGFTVLNEQLTAIYEMQNAHFEIQNAQLARIGSAVNLNNALQAKANVDSMRLMQDVSYMRNLAHNAEIRRLNNV